MECGDEILLGSILAARRRPRKTDAVRKIRATIRSCVSVTQVWADLLCETWFSQEHNQTRYVDFDFRLMMAVAQRLRTDEGAVLAKRCSQMPRINAAKVYPCPCLGADPRCAQPRLAALLHCFEIETASRRRHGSRSTKTARVSFQ